MIVFVIYVTFHAVSDKKFKELVKEIDWRMKNKDYEEDDKLQLCIHETIDKDVSFISIAEVEELTEELGIHKILEIEESYLNEFGELPQNTQGDNIQKLRLLLYWYFEHRYYEQIEQ